MIYAAFDTVDHTILLSFLENHIGLKGTVLQRFHSYLSDRSQRISVNNVVSDMVGLSYSVPQGLRHTSLNVTTIS